MLEAAGLIGMIEALTAVVGMGVFASPDSELWLRMVPKRFAAAVNNVKTQFFIIRMVVA